jgi:hypothetical protein
VGCRRPDSEAPDLVAPGSILLCSELLELFCCSKQLPSGLEVQLFERETQPVDDVVSIAIPEPAALLAELHVAPTVLRIEKRTTIRIVRASRAGALEVEKVSKADEGRWCFRVTQVEQPDDGFVFGVELGDVGILVFQHEPQPVFGVPTQQPARVHLRENDKRKK